MSAYLMFILVYRNIYHAEWFSNHMSKS